MWQAVRRELARLEWDVEPPLTLDLMADWTRTVSSLVAIRRALGPISTADPLALLATATTGAARTAEEELSNPVDWVIRPRSVGCSIGRAVRPVCRW